MSTMDVQRSGSLSQDFSLPSQKKITFPQLTEIHEIRVIHLQIQSSEIQNKHGR